jgi:hypothetical protein
MDAQTFVAKYRYSSLNEAVFAAYGWPSDLTDQQILERLLELNLAPARG